MALSGCTPLCCGHTHPRRRDSCLKGSLVVSALLTWWSFLCYHHYKHNIIFTTYKPPLFFFFFFPCQILFYNFVTWIKISTFLFAEFLCSFFCFWERIGGRFLAAFGAFAAAAAAAAAFGNLQRTNFLHLQGLWNYICFGKSFVFWVCVFWWRCGFFLGNCDQIVECWKACVLLLLLLLCLMMIHDMFVVVS